MNIIDLVEKNARFYPHGTAYVEIRPLSKVRREISWMAFYERTNRLANALLDRGIGKGQSVFLLGRNSLGWLESYFAVLKTGAWIIPLNFRFTDDDILYCAQVAKPAAFIFDEEFKERIETIRHSMPATETYIAIEQAHPGDSETLETLIESASPVPPECPLRDEEACALYFTSGTTGAPKPVLLSHVSLLCTAINESTNNGIDHKDSLLMMPPLYHLAIGHLLGVLMVGGKTVLLTERISPVYIFEAIARERISYLFLLVPWALDMIEALDKKEIRKESYDLESWRFTQMGAQAIPPSLVKRLKEHFPHMQYDTTYGLSESAGPGVIHLGIKNEHKVGAIGRPSLMWDARMIDAEGRDVNPGEVGELIVKGNGVMREYYKNPELSDQTIRKGWLYTGDLARMDEDGFIFLVDRKKDLVISGGENIFPAEVEEVILRHPKVHDAAVIGTPDERLGEIVTAVIQIVSGETLSKEEIAAYCEENLPRYKRPRAIHFGAVPRSPTGKIEKPKIRAKYC
ncbi:MAG: AMP-binding protein [Deltaproteobacteria bacterium]|nr:AMP-binding protein [Deltaproteobacteria bacterium]